MIIRFLYLRIWKIICIVVRIHYYNIIAAIPDIVLIGTHIKPSDAAAELDALVKVFDEAVQKFFTFNVLFLGDMNADCSYVTNKVYDQLYFTTDNRFLWLIDKLADTTVADAHCAYDR